MSRSPSVKSNLTVGAEIELEIEKMAVGGSGLGRYENAVVFVPLTAPGDHIKVKITEAKKNFYVGEVSDFIEPSDLRVTPRCIHFGECGGCLWQHLDQATQLKQKQEILQGLVNKFLPEWKVEVPEVIPSSHFYNYRNRIQPKKSGKAIGYHKRKSSDLVDVKECHLLEKPLADEWNNLKSSIQADSKLEGRAEIYLDKNNQPKWRWIEDIVEDSLFSQVNRFQNEDLINFCINLFEKSPPRNFLELYAGAGNFTFPLFKKFHKNSGADKPWVAVEKAPGLVEAALQHMQNTKISPSQLQFFAADTELFIKRWGFLGYDTIFVDPPRGGLSENVLKTIVAAAPRRILYISCNPVSLCRDLQRFGDLHGRYRLSCLQSFEMFPQTDHFETIAELMID